VPELVGALVGAGARIRAVVPSRETLEDAFVRLMDEPDDEPASAGDRRRGMNVAKRLLPAASLLVLCIFFSVKSPRFLSLDNWFALSSQYAYLLLIGAGATLVIVSGGIDLSVGSVVALAGVATADALVNHHAPVWVGILVGVGVGALAGLVNGLIITRLRVPAFIATLGTLLVARGLALRLARGVTIDGTPDAFNALAYARPLGIPAPLLLVAAVLVWSASCCGAPSSGATFTRSARTKRRHAHRACRSRACGSGCTCWAARSRASRAWWKRPGSVPASRPAARTTNWTWSRRSSWAGRVCRAARAAWSERCSARC
jgi:hypothetical protein